MELMRRDGFVLRVERDGRTLLQRGHVQYRPIGHIRLWKDCAKAWPRKTFSHARVVCVNEAGEAIVRVTLHSGSFLVEFVAQRH